MRRYKLAISDREFVIDVQEVAADRFEVVVGSETYAVNLSAEEDLGEAIITPGIPTAPGAVARSTAASRVAPVRQEAVKAMAPAATPRPLAGGASKGALTAPMPGVIIEVKVKAGDRVDRGQPVAVLDAMKMHNIIGAPRAGVIAEVFVSAGQTVAHGDAIVAFGEG